MTCVELLRKESELAYAELTESIEGVDEAQAWAILQPGGSEYLHTNGSVQGMVLHVATGKMIYGSVAFRNSEKRWRDCAADLDAFEPSWNAAKEYLARAHDYWLETWADVKDADLETEVLHFSGKSWPAWKIIRMIAHHDSYHAGQIVVLRYGVTTATTPPPSEADDIRRYCMEMPSW